MSRPLSLLFVAALSLAAFGSTAAASGKTGRDDKAGAPAAPVAEWRIGPVMGKDGAFAYCMAENRYDNGQTLMIARNPRDEFNIGLGAPGAHLGKGSAWRVTVTVDGLKRDRQAVAPDPDMLVIANGGDDRLYDALIHGEVLTIEGPTDAALFQLKGVGKALRDLRGCVEHARSGQPAKALGRITGDKPNLPPLLKRLLAEAGFKTVGVLPASAAPPGHGQVDSVWRIGPVTSGLGESRNEARPALSTLVDAAVARLKERCGADTPVTQGATDTLPGGSILTASADCGASHVSLLFNLGKGGLFKAFFFEAPAADAETADKQRDAIADVLKRLANL